MAFRHQGYEGVRAWAAASRCSLVLLCCAVLSGFTQTAPRLKIADNHRYIVFDDGRPFFYLGDTAWELFHKLNREEAEYYLRNRAAKGFTVIQAVVLAELDGLHTPNAYGHTPLKNDDPLQPQAEYFGHVDWVVAKANELGLFIGMLPTWGDKWNKAWGAGPEIFTPETAEAYGRWLGERYRDAGIIWILGGDRPVENDRHKQILRAMAKGLREGDGGGHLLTLHPTGGQGSSQWFHDEAWLDFNMRQNGHVTEFTARYSQTFADYDRQPVKPVLDGEPIYEDHPVSFDAPKLGHSVAADVRRPLYWDLFSGACGHTYGHHSVWQMYDPAKGRPVNNPLMTWREALDQPGAAQMQHARKLIESRPFLTRVPDDSVVVPDKVPTAVPGAGTRQFVATRDAQGSYAMVYAPVGRSFKVRLSKISGRKAKAWWFNPRDGSANAIGVFPCDGEHEFAPPDKGELLDWVLVLDDVSKKFAAPGSKPLVQKP
ncbi:MAG TPA: glycoside hydrolase family 140 protein [Verrucomicrobiae bacterium]